MLLEIGTLLKRANHLSATHLPLGGSLVAYELLLNLYLHQVRSEQVTIKALFAGIPYSDMGIRYHLRKLITDGWLELKPAAHDKRTKICVPTSQFDEAWQAIMAELATLARENGLLPADNSTTTNGHQQPSPIVDGTVLSKDQQSFQ